MNEFARDGDDDVDPTAGDLPAARQTKLVELIKERGQMTVGELVTRFGVSRDTIRRDLTQLELRGSIVRTHGGAVPTDRIVTSTPLSRRMDVHIAAKQRIGAAAARLVRDGETLIVNGGSTTTYFAGELGNKRDLTVVTNNLRVVAALPESCVRAIYVLGGTYVASAQTIVGFEGFAALPLISVNTAVIAPAGISAAGFSIGSIEEAHATRAMLARSRRTILVADSSKFNVNAFAHVANFEHVEHFVTDAMPDGPLHMALGAAGVRIVVSSTTDRSGE